MIKSYTKFDPAWDVQQKRAFVESVSTQLQSHRKEPAIASVQHPHEFVVGDGDYNNNDEEA